MASLCRFCAHELSETVVDLGLSPVSNALRESSAQEPQQLYPLEMMVCGHCWLVQLSDVATPPHFDVNYAYFSSYSTSWLDHAKSYAARMIDMLGLDTNSRVIEVASNDGYLLQFFKTAGVPVLGIEPSANVAAHARDHHGIETLEAFFGRECADRLASEHVQADLIVANNVLAHVPDLNDFVAGFARLLRPGGTITFEFPHLLNMLRLCQFDTIYHEHYSYLSLGAVERILATHGLAVFGAEELPTHGGSLRIFASHADNCRDEPDLRASLARIRAAEVSCGLESLAPYSAFSSAVAQRKEDLRAFLNSTVHDGKRVAGYGAPAKASTLLNYCRIGPELLPYTVDVSPRKQGRMIPGIDIPIHAPIKLMTERPDYIIILPWNLRDEIKAQLAPARDWGAQFVVAIPQLEIF